MAYTDVDALKRYLGIARDETADDVLLDTLIDAAARRVERATGRVFEASTDTTRYFANDAILNDGSLKLDADLCAVTSALNGSGAAIAAASLTGVPRNETPWFALKIKHAANTYWQANIGEEISVTGKWAYSLVAPDDIAQATVRLAAYFYRQKDNAGDLDRAIVSAGGTILPASLPKDVDSMIAPYKRVTT